MPRRKRTFVFYPNTLQWVELFTSGRRKNIASAAVARDVQRFANGTRDALRDLTRELVNGDISLQAWYDQMRYEIKLANRAAIDIARGCGPFTKSDAGAFGHMMRDEYAWLNNFARDLQSGRWPLDGRAIQRAGMYGSRVRPTFENWRMRMAKKVGYTEARRVLGPAEHCEPGERPGCVELAAQGWMPIDQVVPIGAATCLTHCQCTLEFRRRKKPVQNYDPSQPRAPKGTSKGGQWTSTDELRRRIQAKTHTVDDVISGKHAVGVEGGGGRDIEKARRAGLFTTTFGTLPIYAISPDAAAPLIDYLRAGGKYGSEEFSRILGYTQDEIDVYMEYLRRINDQRGTDDH